MLALLAGSALSTALFLISLVLDKVRKAKHARYALIIAITAQAANAFLETVAYEVYSVFDLTNWLIVLGAVGMLLAFVFCGLLHESLATQVDS